MGFLVQALDPNRTTWNITWGTYGARLHGDERPTVDRLHNKFGTPFLASDPARLAAEAELQQYATVLLTHPQRLFVEDALPGICTRGGWNCRVCAAGPNHVHVLCDVDPLVHGKQVRALLKRWLTQTLNETWVRPPGGTWWAEGGSNLAIHNQEYLDKAFLYIARQRACVRNGGFQPVLAATREFQ